MMHKVAFEVNTMDDELKKKQDEDVAVEEQDEDMGSIQVDDEVLSIVAGLAASEVPGVYGMSGGIRGGINDMLGKQNFSKGIKVYTEGKTVRVEVHMIITYGYNIPDVAIKLQEKVKEAVESMAGYEVTAVDVHVEGVRKDKLNNLEETKDDVEDLEKKYKEAESEELSQKSEVKPEETKVEKAESETGETQEAEAETSEKAPAETDAAAGKEKVESQEASGDKA
jgi:uncharacterized alkaline shock family protein YloU